LVQRGDFCVERLDERLAVSGRLAHPSRSDFS
jgi:hypothetical protein